MALPSGPESVFNVLPLPCLGQPAPSAPAGQILSVGLGPRVVTAGVRLQLRLALGGVKSYEGYGAFPRDGGYAVRLGRLTNYPRGIKPEMMEN